MTDQEAQTATESSEVENNTSENVPDHGAGRGNEAARYRVKLRETEAERDTLNTKIQRYQWAEVERHLDRIENPEILQRLGHTLDDFLTEDGDVDPVKVATVSGQAADDLGLKAETHGPRMPLEGRAPSSGADTPKDVQQALRKALGIQ
ncbi:hypothetical protein LSI54_09110 [Nesterenkonia sp. AY15]|uniref:hypothetical protein n=1 Tax=Nesterenkonia sp. AY15 TaxID=2901139 RepID=UPI001F4C9B73|nr:hypothetical protein [Nesterenkonia sp. AY15]MCH8571509.1 hypothetical protein [Nesterenkonia sp. AY15]